jgi:hypothetical protein
VRVVSVKWTKDRPPGVMIKVFRTEALMEAVLEALVTEPEAMAKTLKMFREAAEGISDRRRRSSRRRP